MIATWKAIIGVLIAAGAVLIPSPQKDVVVEETIGVEQLAGTGQLWKLTGNKVEPIVEAWDIEFNGELLPDGMTCGIGEILKRTGADNWDCAADDSGSAGVASDGLDFDEFVDAMTLDATTTVASNGFKYAFNEGSFVGVGTTNPQYALDVAAADSGVYPLSLTSAGKYVRIGALNSTYAHMDTDTTGGFYMYDPLTIGGSGTALSISAGNMSVANNGATTISVSGYSDTSFTYPNLQFTRYRGSIGAAADVIAGDYTGSVNFYGRVNGVGAGLATFNAQVDSIVGNYARGKLVFAVSDGTSGGANNEAFAVTASTTTFNDIGKYATFRVESDTDANSLVVTGNNGNVGIGKLAPVYKLAVAGTASVSGGFFGAGLSDCDADGQTLSWNATDGMFGCGDDDTGAGGGVSSNSLDFDEFVNAMTVDAPTTIDTTAGLDITPSISFASGMANIGYYENPDTAYNALNLDSEAWVIGRGATGFMWSDGTDMQITGPGGFDFSFPSGYVTFTGGQAIELSTPYTLMGGDASVSGNFELDAASTFQGSGLADCDGDGQTLGWDSTTRLFTCGDDDTGAGGVASNSLDFDEFVDNMTLDADTGIASAGYQLSLGTTWLDFNNLASISYGYSAPVDYTGLQLVSQEGIIIRSDVDTHIDSLLNNSRIYIGGGGEGSVLIGGGQIIAGADSQNVDLNAYNPGGAVRINEDTSANLLIYNNASISQNLEVSGFASISNSLYISPDFQHIGTSGGPGVNLDGDYIFMGFDGPVISFTVDSGTDFTVTDSGASFSASIELGGKLGLFSGASFAGITEAGDMYWDTTSDQLQVRDSAGTTRALDPIREKSFTIASTTFDVYDNVPLWAPDKAITIYETYCWVTGGTSQVVTISDGTNNLDAQTCDTTGVNDTSLSNNTWTANEKMEVDFGTNTGATDWVTFTIRYRYDAD